MGRTAAVGETVLLPAPLEHCGTAAAGSRGEASRHDDAEQMIISTSVLSLAAVAILPVLFCV